MLTQFGFNSGSSGRVVEIIPGGSEKPITYADVGVYTDAVIRTRMNESAAQFAALRHGLVSSVPTSVLSLLTWRELELKVCCRFLANRQSALRDRRLTARLGGRTGSQEGSSF